MAATQNDLGVLFALRQQDKEALKAFEESITHAQKTRIYPCWSPRPARTPPALLLRLDQPAEQPSPPLTRRSIT
jgi:hypothetical protein